MGCAKSKAANGAVAVGLPHRNRSVFKQAPINKRKVIAKPTPMLAKRKGPFPEGKRVGSWGKKKKKKKNLILVSIGHVTLGMGKKDT